MSQIAKESPREPVDATIKADKLLSLLRGKVVENPEDQLLYMDGAANI